MNLRLTGIIMMVLAGCSHPEARRDLGAELNEALRDSYADTRSLDVIFATNREPAPEGATNCSSEAFTVRMGTEVHYGSCQINTPKKHAVGAIEVATDARADTHEFFRPLGYTALDLEGVRRAIQDRHPESVLVFVHGFNVKFQDAVMRAAQIAYDLKFQGPVVLFSWPAGAEGTLNNALVNRTYHANREAAVNSVPALAAFLRFLSTLGVPVHLLVHSMGHQVVVPARALASADPIVRRGFIRELVMNAPDIATADFLKAMSQIRELVHRTTVYCSFNDRAIAASQTYNSGARLGACERVEGVDMINVSGLDAPTLGLGHGYYSARPVLTDVFQILLGIDAERRLFMRKSEPNSVESFFLRP